MTNVAFPAMASDDLRLAGYLNYKPWVQFDEAHMRVLQQILDQQCDIDGCENPDIIADWREVARGPDDLITHRSNIILYRDGGDWAEEENGHYTGIGLLFCRQDIDQTTTPHTASYRVHLPDSAWQDTLLACCANLIDDMKLGSADKLNTIQAYLKSVINDQAVWKPLRQLLDELDVEHAEL